MKPQPIEPLLSSDDIATIFGVGQATVSGWARDKKISAVKVPGIRGYRFRRADVEALIATEAAS